MPRIAGEQHEISEDLRRQLLAAANAQGRSHAEIGEKAGLDRTTVGRILRGEVTTSARLPQLCQALDVAWNSESETVSSSSTVIEVLGFVGALDMYSWKASLGPWAPVLRAEVPAGFRGYSAVQVDGNGMAPRYQNGDLLLFRKPESGWDKEACMGLECVVQLRGGSAYVRLLERVARSLALSSYAGSGVVVDPEIEWAAPVEAALRAGAYKIVPAPSEKDRP